MFSWRSLKENGKLTERFPILENGGLIQDLSGIHRLGKLTVNEGFLAVCASFSLLSNLINRLHLKFLPKLRKNFKNIAFGGRPAATALFSTRYESVVTKVKA